MSREKREKFYNLAKRADVALRDNGIDYFCIAGTLLGCVRNEDIILWDDDIDFGILEKDLKKLQSINFSLYGLASEGLTKNNTGKLVLIEDAATFDTRKNFGVFLDIFVFEKNGNSYQYANKEALNTWPFEYFYENELFPLKKYKFGPCELNGPNLYENYCCRAWGSNWRKPKLKFPKNMLYPEAMLL